MPKLKTALVLLVCAALGSNFFLISFFRNVSGVCPIRERYGVNCPGCGGRRSFFSMLKGDIPSMLDYHFLFALCVIIAVGVLIFSVFKKSLPKLRSAYAWGFLVVALVFVIVRNTDTALGRYLAP